MGRSGGIKWGGMSLTIWATRHTVSFVATMLRLAICSLFFTALTLFIPARANELVPFGNSEGFHYIIAISFPESRAAEASALFAQGRVFFEGLAARGQMPAARISLGLIENDYSRLPEDLRPSVPEGAAEIIELLEGSGDGAVILILPQDEPGKVTVKYGAANKTSSPELVSALVEALEGAKMDWHLEESRAELYRIGWASNHHIIRAYFNAGIPAIALSASANVFPSLAETLRTLSSVPSLSEQNYAMLKLPTFLERAAQSIIPGLGKTKNPKAESSSALPFMHLAGGQFVVLSERFMVLTLIFCFSFFLIYLSVLFLFNPTIRKYHVRGFLLTLPYTVLLAAVNFLSIYLGGKLASALIFLKLGKPEAWVLIPRAAFFAKFSAALLLATLFSSLKSYFPVTRDPISLGHAAVVAALVNIFIFSALEFTMAGYFIVSYIFILACAHSKTLFPQLALSLLAALVFAHLYTRILTRNTAAISAVYSNEGAWNVLIAFFVLPFQLMLLRISEEKRQLSRLRINLPLPAKRRIRISIPIMPAAAAVLLASSALALFLAPAWSEGKPLRVLIRQRITEESATITVDSSVDLKNASIERNLAESSILKPFSQMRPKDFISANVSSRDFLDRKVYELAINPLIKARRIDIAVFSEEGIAVNLSSDPFQLEEGGREARFNSGENPETPIRISFVTGTSSPLRAEILCWSVENPFGFHIKGEGISESALLFIKKEISLSDGTSQ